MRMRLLLVVLLALLAAPAAAQAGCLAEGGTTSVAPPNLSTFGKMNCTTNNGSHYQLRLYVQSNYGGTWHTVGPGATWDIYSPCNNCSYRRDMSTSCTYFEGPATAVRSKAVVENIVAGSIDVDVGPVSSLPITCQ